jgi:hypothetical protein
MLYWPCAEDKYAKPYHLEVSANPSLSGNQKQVYCTRRRQRGIFGSLCGQHRRMWLGVYIWQKGKGRKESLGYIHYARLVL